MKIQQMTAAPPGAWAAVYEDEDARGKVFWTEVALWALVDDEGRQKIVGLCPGEEGTVERADGPDNFLGYAPLIDGELDDDHVDSFEARLDEPETPRRKRGRRKSGDAEE